MRATAWAESLGGAMSGHQSWAVLRRYRCRLLLPEILKGVDRNAELKLRLHLRETGQIRDPVSKVLGQQNSGPLRRTARNQQSHEGFVGSAAQGSADFAGTGLQLSSHGAWALELIPPVRSAPRRRELPEVVEGTSWHRAR